MSVRCNERGKVAVLIIGLAVGFAGEVETN
jgi:hypothetical protein